MLCCKSAAGHLRPGRELRLSQGEPAVKEFVRLVPPQDLYLSVITVGEVYASDGSRLWPSRPD
jgi:hypothetical protein